MHVTGKFIRGHLFFRIIKLPSIYIQRIFIFEKKLHEFLHIQSLSVTFLEFRKLYKVSTVITHFWVILQIHFFSSKKSKNIRTKNKKIQKIITVRKRYQSA
jgi:hypothetical protein